MEEPNDEHRLLRPLHDLEPEARRTVGYLFTGVLLAAFLVYLVFAFIYKTSEAFLVLGTIAAIVGAAVLLHRLQTIQFSLKTILIAILTLQIPMGLLLTSKSPLQTNLGLVALLIWSAGVVAYVLVSGKRA